MQHMPQKVVGEPRPFGKTQQEEPNEGSDGGGEVPASEEEQAQYELVVSRALSFMHGDGQEGVLKTLGSAETPAQGVGLVTAKFARMAKKSARDQGKDIDDEVLLNAASEIVEDLMELGQEAKVFQFEDEQEAQEQTEESLLWAMKYYGMEALEAGELDMEQAKQAMQQGLAQEQQGGGAAAQGDNPQVAEAVRTAINEKPKKPGLIGTAMAGA